MKIIGWTDWQVKEDINSKYEAMNPKTWADTEEIEKIIADELRDKGYKFTGDYHQNGDFGVPIFDNDMVYQCTQRSWGGIMLMAYPDEIDDTDGLGYTDWAWISPKPMVIPNNSDYVKKTN